jgi:hypothetical protein
MPSELSAEERRKLRLDAMKKRRAATSVGEDGAATMAVVKKVKVEDDLSSVTSDRKKSNTPKKKVDTQVRYDPPPNVHMTEDELKEWRKEQRRIRNRDSAAASRARTKDRITELEAQNEELMDKVDSLRDKHAKRCTEYQAKIKALEDQLRHFQGARDLAAVKQQEHAFVSGSSSSEGEGDGEQNMISPSSSPVISSSSELSSVSSMMLSDKGDDSHFLPSSLNANEPQQHIISEMISRPAVKITGVVDGNFAFLKMGDDEFSPLPLSRATSVSAILALEESSPRGDSVVLGNDGRVLQMDPMLYDVLCEL